MKETGGLGLKLEGFINFDIKNKNEKYILILTTEELMKKKNNTILSENDSYNFT